VEHFSTVPHLYHNHSTVILAWINSWYYTGFRYTLYVLDNHECILISEFNFMQLDSKFHLMIPYVTLQESYFLMFKHHNTVVAFPCERSTWNRLQLLPSVDTTDFRIYSRVLIFVNLNDQDFDLSRSPVQYHCSDLKSLVLMKWDQTTWLARQYCPISCFLKQG